MKRIIYLILIAIFANIKIYMSKLNDLSPKLDIFYYSLGESVKYQENNDFLIVFNYEEIEKNLDRIFEGYQVSIIMTSSTSFRLEIHIRELFLKSVITEKYYLIKGENYEKFN